MRFLPRCEPLFLHGFAGDAGHWDEVRDLLDPKCRGAALVLAGHGARREAVGPFTVERCARDAIQRLPREGALLVGHSMGARIALETAAQAPELVKGLVLVDGSDAPASPATVMAEMRSAIRNLGVAAAMTEIVEEFLLNGLEPTRREEIIEQAINLPGDVALSYWGSMASWDTSRFLDCVSLVNCPVVILQSTSLVEAAKLERHTIENVPCSRWLDAWQGAGKARITQVPNCGHYAMIERPDSVAKAIRSVLSVICRA